MASFHAAASLALLLSLALASSAQVPGGSDPERRLREELENRIFALRQPLRGRTLHFDAEGRVRGEHSPGTLAADCHVMVLRLEIRKVSLRLMGARMVEYYDRGGVRRLTRKREDVILEIDLPAADYNSAVAALDRVFHLQEAPSPLPPPEPSTYESPQFEFREGDEGVIMVRRKGSRRWRRATEVKEPIEVARMASGEPVYIFSRAVQLPKAIHTPDPEFPSVRPASNVAQAQIRIIIDRRGLVHALAVAQDSDRYFSESSALTIASWRFEPARIAGEPVALLLGVRVNFKYQ